MPDDSTATVVPIRRPGMAWMGELTRGDKGLHATVANAIICLCNDHELHNLLAYDEFAYRVILLKPAPVAYLGAVPSPGPYPRPMSDGDVTLIQSYLQRANTLRISQAIAQQAIDAAAEYRRVHPVRDWLASLVWDAKPRLDTWLHIAFGAPEDDYHSEVGIKFLVAAVRRVRQPGCKFDTMPVLEGSQEIGKSTSCRALFGDTWFSDEMPDMRSKEAPLSMQGVWGVEVSELGAIIRAEVEVVKAFLSRQVDKFREVYGRRYIDRPRQTLLIGTTNDTDYLRDSTGNRRFWPIACTKAEAAWIAENREQLWAEAAALEAAGESIWLTDGVKTVARQVQADRVPEDMWASQIRDHLYNHGTMTSVRVSDILQNVIGLAADKRDRRTEMRVTGVLKAEGWECKVVRVGGKVQRTWMPIDARQSGMDL